MIYYPALFLIYIFFAGYIYEVSKVGLWIYSFLRKLNLRGKGGLIREAKSKVEGPLPTRHPVFTQLFIHFLGLSEQDVTPPNNIFAEIGKRPLQVTWTKPQVGIQLSRLWPNCLSPFSDLLLFYNQIFITWGWQFSTLEIKNAFTWMKLKDNFICAYFGLLVFPYKVEIPRENFRLWGHRICFKLILKYMNWPHWHTGDSKFCTYIGTCV